MRARWILLVALAAAGCKESEGADAGDAAGSSGDQPSPYAESDDETGADIPGMAVEEVVSTSVAALKAFMSLQPDAVVAAYQNIAVLEEGCPEEQETYDEDGVTVTYWYTEIGCTTSAGVEFRGGARFEATTSEVEGVMLDAATLSSEGGTLRVSGSDGRFFEMTGYVSYQRGVGEGTEAGFDLSGTFSADSDTASGSPLLDGSIAAQGYLYSADDGDFKAVGGAGSLSGEGLGSARAFAFSDLWFLPGCATEPLGTISVRDDVGFWHDVVFDAGMFAPGEGDEEPVFVDANCNGCGAYLAGGKTMGEACLTSADMDSILDWEGAPW